MSSTLLARLRRLERYTATIGRTLPAEWRQPFRVTDYYRPAELLRFDFYR